MKWTQRAGVASPFSKEREGEAWAWPSASRFEQLCEVAFVGSQTPHLSPLPFSKGRGNKPRDLLRIAVIAKTTSLRFPMEKLVETHGMRGTRLGRLAVLSPFGRDGRANASEGNGVSLGEGRVRLGLRQVALIIANWCSLVKPPHLNPLPFCKGRSDKKPRVWASVAPASTRSSLKFR